MSVTREDVIWAYRMILGREPENENVIISHKNKHESIFSLRNSLLNGNEFLRHRLQEALNFEKARNDKSIIVNSHRRSGTHFLMDQIIENFPFEKQWAEKANTNLFDLLNRRIVLKNHLPSQSFRDRSITPEISRNICKNIFIYRNPYHTLRSMYYFDLNGIEPTFKVNKKMKFSEYLKAESIHARYESKTHPIRRIDYFFSHADYWTNQDDVLFVKYEDLLQRKDDEIRRIEIFLNEERIKNSPQNVDTGIAKGITKKDKDFWSDDVLELFSEDPISSKIRELGYHVANSSSEI